MERNKEKKSRLLLPLAHADRAIRSLYLGLSVLLFLLLVFVFAQYATDRLEKHSRKLLQLDNDLTDLLSSVQDAETGQRGFLLTKKEYYLQPFFEARAESERIITEITSYAGTGLITPRQLDALKLLVNRKFGTLERKIRIQQEEGTERAIALLDTDLGNELMDEIRVSIRDLRKDYRAKSGREIERLRSVNIGTLVIVSVAVVVLLTVFYQIYHSLRPLLNRVEATYQELEAGKAVLAAKNEQLDHFAYIASHDLNEPLRTINSFVKILEEDHQDRFTDETQQFFTYIDDATTRMRGLIDGLLSYSRIGRSSVFEVCDLNVLVEELCQDLSLFIKETNAVVKVSELPTLVCLKAEIRQLIQSLLVNALKFTVPEKTPLIEISAEASPTHWRFRVSDNGIGIAPGQHNKIFGVFTRLHLPSRFAGQGIGLGLSRKIVEVHRGEIWVDSELGEGSRFYFTISKNLADESQAEIHNVD